MLLLRARVMSFGAGSFGARPCRAMRTKILALLRAYNWDITYGWMALPKSWRRKWMTQRILATPPWVDMAAIREIYRDAAARGMTVGHQVPLNHPAVCGLHVPWNLKAEPATVNFSKGNTWMPDQTELFECEGQLNLF